MQIIELSERPDMLEEGINYFWKCWGNDSNLNFYRDCIEHSLDANRDLPKFYLALIDDKIAGTYALLVNDLISRQDLMPWFACLFVEEDHRKKGIAGRLLEHGLRTAADKGYDHLYLSTDLKGFYEKKGWNYLCDGYGFSGGIDKIYIKKTS